MASGIKDEDKEKNMEDFTKRLSPEEALNLASPRSQKRPTQDIRWIRSGRRQDLLDAERRQPQDAAR